MISQPSIAIIIEIKVEAIALSSCYLIISGVETLKGRFPSTLTFGFSSCQSFLSTSGNNLRQETNIENITK